MLIGLFLYMGQNIKSIFFGKRKNPLDPKIFHSVTLIAFFAWIGLGADGLSSSCYGPEEAFLVLGDHAHLALILAFMVMATVIVLSASYSQIIELFPSGGGGYVTASKLLGPIAGLVSGSALLVDYVLTIAISVASCADAIFSLLPHAFFPWKFWATIACLVFLIALNLRGVKESILVLTPIFLAFVITHVVVILYGLFTHGSVLPSLLRDTVIETRTGIQQIGCGAMAAVLLRAFCLGAGTFTGIEAVSNGMQVLREPRVTTGKKTMIYMAASLSFTAGGLLVCYLLNNVQPEHGRTLNAVLIGQLTSSWPFGHGFFLLAMLAEGALLAVAAQTGFLGGPRVMASMAADHWLPHRFTSLSERLVMKDGILVMGLAALAIVFYTHASVRILVVMYSINVFLTFACSQLGMVRHWMETPGPERLRKMMVSVVSLLVTVSILVVMIRLKFLEGGWVTLLLTGALIALCIAIRRHYRQTIKALRDLNQVLGALPIHERPEPPPIQPEAPTAILSVGGYSGIGVHSILAIQRAFPGHFKNMVFLSVGLIDSDRFKGTAEIDALRRNVEADLARYVKLANNMGFYAEGRAGLGTDIIEELELLCMQVAREWKKKVYFMGQLAFEGETAWTRLLHNQTSFALQRKLLFSGLQTVILPIRLRLDQSESAAPSPT